MLSVPNNASIYFYSQPVDLRKGCEGLAYVSSSIINNPPDNAYFLFLNRKRNRIKILYWTSHSFFYWFARSRKGVFAPKKTHTSLISVSEMKMILEGNFPERLKAIFR
jgi:transposase